MECTKAEELICRLVDGALAAGERSELEQHVHECGPCRELRDDLARQDHEMRAAFEGPRAVSGLIAEKSIAALRGARPRRSWAPLMVPFAAAAGFIIAFAGFQRERIVIREVPVAGRTATDARPKPEPRVVTAIGHVGQSGATFTCGDDALAEIESRDGSRVRLAPASSACFEEDRAVRLLSGRLMTKIASGKSPFTVTIGNETVVADAGTIDVSLLAPNVSAVCVLEGTATFRAHRVGASQRMTSNDGECQAGVIDVRDLVMATRWVHPLLVRQGPDNDELRARIGTLIDRLPESAHVRELRSLGECAGPSLVAYLREGRGDAATRSAIASLATDIAGPASVPHFIALLSDGDEAVRMASFRALARLTGESLGQKAEDWRTPSARGCRREVTK